MITSGDLTEFDPEQLPEGVHIHEHCHERTTILIRIGAEAWVGVGTFDDTAQANGGKANSHELPPGKLQCRIALRRAFNAILRRDEDAIIEDADPTGLSWDGACLLLGEISREDHDDRTSLRFMLPLRDGSFTRFSGTGTADEAAFELARKIRAFAATEQRTLAIGARA